MALGTLDLDLNLGRGRGALLSFVPMVRLLCRCSL